MAERTETGAAWWIYLLRNERNALYTGITTQVDRRVSEHRKKQGKGARFTRACREITLVYSCGGFDKSLALKIESRIKSLKKKQKERIVASGFNQSDLCGYLMVPPPCNP